MTVEEASLAVSMHGCRRSDEANSRVESLRIDTPKKDSKSCQGIPRGRIPPSEHMQFRIANAENGRRTVGRASPGGEVGSGRANGTAQTLFVARLGSVFGSQRSNDSNLSICMKIAFLRAVAVVAAVTGVLGTAVVRADANKLVSVGDKTFGADITYVFTDKATKDKYEARFDANANGYVLKKKLNLASGEATLDVQQPSKCHTTGYVKMGGSTLAKWDKSFTGTTTFTTAPFYQAQAGGQAKYGVGPINLTLKAKVEAKAYVRGTVGVSYSSSTRRPMIHASVGPAMDAAGTGSVSADAVVVEIGVKAELKLTGYGLNGNLDYVPRSTGNPTVAYSITADTVSTDGYIQGWVKLDYLIGSKTWKKTFAEYHAGPTSYVLAQGKRQL